MWSESADTISYLMVVKTHENKQVFLQIYSGSKVIEISNTAYLLTLFTSLKHPVGRNKKKVCIIHLIDLLENRGTIILHS